MQRWPLRQTLGATLAVLVLAGVALQQPRHVASGSATTVASTVASGATTTSLRAVTSTTHPRPFHPPRLPAPRTSTAAYRAPERGCRFATAASPRARTPAALGQCVVLEVGDSLGSNLAWGLARELGATPGLTLQKMDLSSTGLVTSWYFNWPQHLRHYLHEYRPHLVVMSFGANDEQGIVVQGRAARFGSAEWHRAYTARVLAMTQLATHAGAYVLWVGMPIMQPVQYRQGAEILNALYASVVPTVPGATFLPTYNLLATPSLNFRPGAHVNGVASVLRASDGIHYSYVGENVVATYVAHEMALIYHVSLAPRAPMYLTR